MNSYEMMIKLRQSMEKSLRRLQNTLLHIYAQKSTITLIYSTAHECAKKTQRKMLLNHNRMCKFPNNEKTIYDLQIGRHDVSLRMKDHLLAQPS